MFATAHLDLAHLNSHPAHASCLSIHPTHFTASPGNVAVSFSVSGCNSGAGEGASTASTVARASAASAASSAPPPSPGSGASTRRCVQRWATAAIATAAAATVTAMVFSALKKEAAPTRPEWIWGGFLERCSKDTCHRGLNKSWLWKKRKKDHPDTKGVWMNFALV